MVSGQVACPSNAATAIVAAANTNSVYVGRGSARTLVLSNPSAQAIYLGGDTSLTSATGFLLAAGATVTLTLGAGDALYGRGASATPTLHYLSS